MMYCLRYGNCFAYKFELRSLSMLLRRHISLLYQRSRFEAAEGVESKVSALMSPRRDSDSALDKISGLQLNQACRGVKS